MGEKWGGNDPLAQLGTNLRKRQDKEHRQRVFLDALRDGANITQATAAAKVVPRTYSNWRVNDRAFRAECDTILMRILGQNDALTASDWDGKFTTGRKIFFGFDSYFHQREIIYAIEKTQPGEVVLILVAPETGKTTVLEDHMALKLGVTPNNRITYVSESQIRTRKIAGRLQRRMTNYSEFETYIRRFGPFYERGQERQGKPWASDYFTVFRADHDERDYSFEGRGWRSAVQGTRTDDLYIDDIQSLRSLNQTSDIVDRLRQDFFSRPGLAGRIYIVGTRVGSGDVYEVLQDEGIVTRTVILPMVDREGNSLCPEMWPIERLQVFDEGGTLVSGKRKLVGESAWWRNYMQQPQAAMDATFTDMMIDESWDIARTIGQTRYPDRVCLLDPSLTGGNGMIVAGYGVETMELMDVDYSFNLARWEEVIIKIERFAALYGFGHLVVEINAFQRGLQHDERLVELSRRYGFRIVPHITGVNKQDIDLGVGRMPVAFIKNEIRLPGGDPRSRERFHVLAEQLGIWRPDIPRRKRRDDLVMALWFGWIFWSNKRKALDKGHTPLQRAGMPWAPLQRARGPMTRRVRV